MKTKIFLILLFICTLGFGQQNSEEYIELKNADQLTGVLYNGVKANLLEGNVKVYHDGTNMSCKKAYLFGEMNNFDAFGSVVIRNDDGMTVYGDSLFYNASTRIAKLRGNVRVVKDGMVINTNYLDYDTQYQTALYFGGGKIRDNGTYLESQSGFYDSKQAFYSFKGDVLVTKQGYKIESDTLKYAQGTEKAYFFGPTNIYTQDKHLYTEWGIYLTQEEKGWFSKNAWVESETYKLSGDSLYYDNKMDYGYAIKNVEIISYEQDATIYGDVAVKEGYKNKSTVFGHTLMVDRGETDTTYISADTLVSVEDTTGRSNIFAYRHVKILQGELSGLCDSMIYRGTDSTISLYYDPILWNANTQIVADSILVKMAFGSVRKMLGYQNSFLISQSLIDTLRFDQIKGRNIVAYFDQNEFVQLDVDGNAESIYYAYNEEDALIGVNNVLCSEMKMYLVNNNMDNIRFYDRPIAKFVPPHKTTEQDVILYGFDWQAERKPSQEQLYQTLSGRQAVDKGQLQIPENLRFINELMQE